MTAISAGRASTVGTAALFESQDGYVTDLLSYSLDRLTKEPELLHVDGEQLQRQLQEVAVGHYRSFITAAECVESVHTDLTQVDEHLHSLLEGLPLLEAGCKDFARGAEEIAQKRALNRQMLACHTQLLDLLEVPSLMDTCVRNGNYDDALDLEAFAGKLAVLHARLPVVVALQQQVRAISGAMLHALLLRLQSSIHLPECLRVIGYLRRMAVFSERQMRLNFLQCREAWFSQVVEELDRTRAYDFLKRLTDCHRMHLFDVVMQYRAIFADDTSSVEAAEGADGGLLYSWATHRVGVYLREVEAALPGIAEGSSLASVLDHCMYCGMSLGRVGLDFRALLPPLFEARVAGVVHTALSVTVDVLARTLDGHQWVPLPAPHGDGAAVRGSGGDEGTGPPYSLMEHPPVAVFVNGVLSALNELRHCAPAALHAPLAAAVHDTLSEGAARLVRYHATRPLEDSEAASFLALVRAYAEVAAPYIATSFGRVYYGDTAAVHLASALTPLKQLLLLRSDVTDEAK